MDGTVKGKVPSSIFYSLIFTTDSPGKSPIVTQRKRMLVAQLLIRYPPVIRRAPRRETVFSPVMSQIMAPRRPRKKGKRKNGKYEVSALAFPLMHDLREQLKEKDLGVLCIL